MLAVLEAEDWDANRDNEASEAVDAVLCVDSTDICDIVESTFGVVLEVDDGGGATIVFDVVALEEVFSDEDVGVVVVEVPVAPVARKLSDTFNL